MAAPAVTDSGSTAPQPAHRGTGRASTSIRPQPLNIELEDCT